MIKTDLPVASRFGATLGLGAGDHVLSKVDVPGYKVVPSAGSEAGLHFAAAGGKRIPVEGQVHARHSREHAA